MPSITLGTANYKNCQGTGIPSDCWKPEAKKAVRSWLEMGGTGVDTAQWYRNEVDVGLAIGAANVSRETVFLETKCRCVNLNVLSEPC